MQSAAAFRDELARLKQSPSGDAPVPGIGTVRFLVRCSGDAAEVLATAKRTLLAVAGACVDGWDEAKNWDALLPERFVRTCAHEMTRSEADAWLARWQKLSQEQREQEERSRAWSLGNWLHWLSPAERSWLWWDAAVLDEDHIAVAVAVEEWPFPWGALSWLFRGCGADEVFPKQ